ncbi:hypothetical protein QWY28_17230 [Nocardioides sp. SOB77]|uniref:Uncharacterized protein n=1 Tax=Nocardioides oceani TaxID=3058369 RepID=A0ABT8FK09_9ACTN|nr:hypothetical protein [Nocardioides oceani]MDN4174707.1 hypothetical protein [Nocardioides oceani]
MTESASKKAWTIFDAETGIGTRVVGEMPMFHPGRCRWCGSIYDGGKVEVTGRYSDCSVWKAPCCGNTADDRPQSWGGSFFPLTNAERRRLLPPGSSRGGEPS